MLKHSKGPATPAISGLDLDALALRQAEPLERRPAAVGEADIEIVRSLGRVHPVPPDVGTVELLRDDRARDLLPWAEFLAGHRARRGYSGDRPNRSAPCDGGGTQAVASAPFNRASRLARTGQCSGRDDAEDPRPWDRAPETRCRPIRLGCRRAGTGAAGTIVAGVPTREGTFTFSVKGVDNEGNPLKQTYRIKVGPPEPLTDTTESQLPGGAVGEAYAANFFLSGGVGPYTWSLAAGKLPPGLHLISTDAPEDNDNQLAGTPTAAGTFTFTIRVTDSRGHTAAGKVHVTIEP